MIIFSYSSERRQRSKRSIRCRYGGDSAVASLPMFGCAGWNGWLMCLCAGFHIVICNATRDAESVMYLSALLRTKYVFLRRTLIIACYFPRTFSYAIVIVKEPCYMAGKLLPHVQFDTPHRQRMNDRWGL